MVDLLEMPSTLTKENSLVVHEALGPGLHERGRPQDCFGPIGVANRDGETPRGKPEGDARHVRWFIPRTVHETHGRGKRFEAVG